MPARLTLRDIARQAGCHYSTVSLALRNHPSISVETRSRVQKLAQALDYRPDAMLAALNAYRVQKRTGTDRPVLAWLTNHSARNAWRLSACNVDYYRGALRRAEERGYRVDHFWLGEPGMSPRRLSEVLRTRGIHGLLLPPQEKIGAVDLDWADFAAVTFGYTLLQPRLHLVSNHEYRTMGTLFAKLAHRNYRRVGLVDLREHDERVDHNWLAAYLLEQHRLRAPKTPPPLIMEGWSDDRFLDWVERHSPDAIVTKLPAVLDCLRRARYAVPEEIGVAFHSLDDASAKLSGMRKNASQIGVMAVDLLVDMLHRNERGVPAQPHLLMVEGSWVEGDTLRPRATTELLVAPAGDASRS